MANHEDQPTPIAPRLDPPPEEVVRLLLDVGLDVIDAISAGAHAGINCATEGYDRDDVVVFCSGRSGAFLAAALAAYDEATT
ncbi:MAG: hypothetical protein S0880_10375 [Actinomycetota bacterium]|nr:hypothetical protein [Actinomycetota bacterium]